MHLEDKKEISPSRNSLSANYHQHSAANKYLTGDLQSKRSSDRFSKQPISKFSRYSGQNELKSNEISSISLDSMDESRSQNNKRSPGDF